MLATLELKNQFYFSVTFTLVAKHWCQRHIVYFRYKLSA